MIKTPQSMDVMLTAWNEKNPEKIRAHLKQALAPNIIFTDPDNFVEGIDQFEAMVRTFLTNNPTAKCERTSGFNHHHNRYRYNWLVSVNGVPAVPGMDVVEVDDQGRVVRVDGFFGPIPDA